MGTNYYLHEKACPTCGKGSNALHIGKSSAGWCFSLHVIADEGINSLEDWQDRWGREGAVIRDEYEEVVTPEKMLSCITGRSWPRTDHRSGRYFRENDACEGPHGLLRHPIGQYCIAHGNGTYDLMPGEFS